MTLSERAAKAFVKHKAITATYAHDTAGLVPDRKIVAAVKRTLKERKAAAVDDDQYLDLIRSGGGRYSSARSLGIDPVLVRRRMAVDKEFQERVLVAEAESLEPIVAAMREQALLDEKVAFKLLASKSAEEFGPPAQKVNVEVRQEITASSDPIVASIHELAQELVAQMKARGLDSIEDAEVIETKEIN